MSGFIKQCRLTLKSARAGEPDLLRLALAEIGISQDDIVEEDKKGKVCLLFYIKKPQDARRLLSRIRALKLKGVSLSLSTLKDADWKTRWKKYARPFNITGKLRVVQLSPLNTGLKKRPDDIFIDTTFAFGTGLHATTQMMAKFISGKKGDFGSFFDVGTGTGILSIIAHKYGAKSIYAIDIDKEAVATARRNFLTNHCRIDYVLAVSFDAFKLKKRFDFLCANLLTEDLIRLKDKLIASVAPGKYLAVSGIYRDNYARFRKKFSSSRLKCLRVSQSKGWYALLFRVKSGSPHLNPLP